MADKDEDKDGWSGGDTHLEETPAPEPESLAPVIEEDSTPLWPQGPDYDPRKDPGPVRPEDQDDDK